MSDSTQAQKQCDANDSRIAAWLACAGVFSGFALYWWVQIQSVRELLEMAYG